MSTDLLQAHATRRFESTHNPWLHTKSATHPLNTEEHTDREFISMLNSYRITQGLSRAQDVFAMVKSHPGNDVNTLARWMVNREVVSFDWQSKIWVPLFQFDLDNMSMVPGIKLVLTVLNPVFSPWEVGVWFARTNRALDDFTPAESLRSDPNGVLRAACIDRFMAA